jgi:hypothetical protein
VVWSEGRAGEDGATATDEGSCEDDDGIEVFKLCQARYKFERVAPGPKDLSSSVKYVYKVGKMYAHSGVMNCVR